MPSPESESRSALRSVQRPRRAGALRRVGTTLAVLVMVAAVAAVAGWWYLFVRSETDVVPGTSITFVVGQGASSASIATRLAREGIVPNSNAFRLRVKDLGAGNDLRAGTYAFVTGMNPDDVIARLEKGPAKQYVTVTIPEGYTVKRIAARLEEKTGISAKEFEKLALTSAAEFPRPWLPADAVKTGSLEGYLFPKTYQIEKGATATDVVNMMLDQFDKETAALRTPGGRYSLHDLVTVASLIEREAKVAKERPLVSSVIANRLRTGMRLELCASVEYLLPANRPRLTNDDLKIVSPYNTYRNKGLPPGPIANPGLASLEAAAHPASTQYLYYVLTGTDGSHTFTSSYSAFLKAKDASRKVVP